MSLLQTLVIYFSVTEKMFAASRFVQIVIEIRARRYKTINSANFHQTGNCETKPACT